MAELAESIKANGLRNPIVVTPDGLILDGRNRWRACQRVGISANALTVTGMLVGVAAAAIVASGHPVAGFLVLWLSGAIDAADGTLARLTTPSPLGAILDITFDRVVERTETALPVAVANPRSVR